MVLLVAWLVMLGAVGSPAYAMLVADEHVVMDASSTKVFVEAGSDSELLAIARRIEGVPGVDVVEVQTPERALAKARELFADDPEVLEDLPGNPFPGSIEVEIDERHRKEAMRQIQSITGVDQVDEDGTASFSAGPIPRRE